MVSTVFVFSMTENVLSSLIFCITRFISCKLFSVSVQLAKRLPLIKQLYIHKASDTCRNNLIRCKHLTCLFAFYKMERAWNCTCAFSFKRNKHSMPFYVPSQVEHCRHRQDCKSFYIVLFKNNFTFARCKHSGLFCTPGLCKKIHSSGTFFRKRNSAFAFLHYFCTCRNFSSFYNER